MQKEIFEKQLGKKIKLVLKPKNFALNGVIDAVFDDCFEFRTEQKTSYITFDLVNSVQPFLVKKDKDGGV